MTREDLIDKLAQNSTDNVDSKALLQMYYDAEYGWYEDKVTHNLYDALYEAKVRGIVPDTFTVEDLEEGE